MSDSQMRLLKLLCAVLAGGWSTASSANCLSEVAGFAREICGDIEKSGNTTVVDGNGKVEIGVSNIVKNVIGGASGEVNGHGLYDTYVGVLQEQLGQDRFNILTCRQKMVEVAVKERCEGKPPTILEKKTGAPGSEGIKRADLNHEELFDLDGGGSKLLTDDHVVFAVIGTPYGARGDLIGVRIEGQASSMAVGSTIDLPAKSSRCKITLMSLVPARRGGQFLLRCS